MGGDYDESLEAHVLKTWASGGFEDFTGGAVWRLGGIGFT